MFSVGASALRLVCFGSLDSIATSPNGFALMAGAELLQYLGARAKSSPSELIVRNKRTISKASLEFGAPAKLFFCLFRPFLRVHTCTRCVRPRQGARKC